MKTAQLDDATKAQVMDLYNKGKAEHDVGETMRPPKRT